MRRLCGRSRGQAHSGRHLASILGGLTLVVAVLAVLAGLISPGAASAAPSTPEAPAAPAAPAAERGGLIIVKVSGLLDPVLADFVERSITDAENRGAVWLVLQVNSSATVISDERAAALMERIRTARVPVGVWVGPSGSKAQGVVGQFAAVADAVGVTPKSRLGKFREPAISPERWKAPYRAALERLRDETVDAKTALQLKLVARNAPVLGDFLIGLDGIDTKTIQTDGGPRQTPTGNSTPVFGALPIGSQLMHTVSSPPVAYLLFTIGMALIVFELFTAGVGVAGLVGAGATVLGCYGLAVLPIRPVAAGLLVLSMLAFAIDVQTGVPRVWTGVGTVALIVGSFFLYDGVAMSWITLLVGIVGILLFMLAGMPAMVRTRFSTPTIGRDWMIGEEGETVAEVAPDGVVQIKGALWRARTNRATPLAVGAAVRVVEVDGLLLEVEPLEGGAKDYRR